VIIETKRATLDTLSVTINALHVSGKQMTLAVFRQLPEASAYKQDGAPADMEFWGLVRYTIKDEGSIWIVAARGGQLYRCNLSRHDIGTTHRELSRLNGAIQALEWWRAYKAHHETNGWAGVAAPAKPYGLRGWAEDQLPHYKQEVEFCREIYEMAKITEDTRAEFEKLPQLFIAV
jgi:hypothetical protein